MFHFWLLTTSTIRLFYRLVSSLSCVHLMRRRSLTTRMLSLHHNFFLSPTPKYRSHDPYLLLLFLTISLLCTSEILNRMIQQTLSDHKRYHSFSPRHQMNICSLVNHVRLARPFLLLPTSYLGNCYAGQLLGYSRYNEWNSFEWWKVAYTIFENYYYSDLI